MGISEVSGLNPLSNTGLIPQNLELRPFLVSVDTLTLMFRAVATPKGAMDICRHIERIFHEKIDFDTHRPTFMLKQWDGCSRGSLRGAMLHWQKPVPFGNGVLRVHLPGKCLASADRDTYLAELSLLCQVYGGEAVRIDVAADDYQKITKLEDIRDSQIAGNYTYFRGYRYITSAKDIGAVEGQSLYFGSPKSDAQLRIYDKDVESGGLYRCIRWELQLRRAKAVALFACILSSVDNGVEAINHTLGSAVAGCIKFIDRTSGSKDLTRCPDLAWWSLIRPLIGTAVLLKVDKPNPELLKKIGWICQAVAPSMACLLRYLGPQEFWQLLSESIDEKDANLSARNLAVLEQAMIDRELSYDVKDDVPWEEIDDYPPEYEQSVIVLY